MKMLVTNSFFCCTLLEELPIIRAFIKDYGLGFCNNIIKI